MPLGPLDLTRQGTIATCGETLVAALPIEPVAIEMGGPVRLFVGGAEANFAIGVSRLGLDVSWMGCVGDDPMGRFVTKTLTAEGVDTQYVVKNDGPTGLYFREWLADGERRPHYYRKDSAGSRWGPSNWPQDLSGVAWLHVSGVTPALSESCRLAIASAMAWARQNRVPISFDPNYRRQLWSPDAARETLLPILQMSRILLIGVDEAELLLGCDQPDEIARRAHSLGVDIVVVKLGANGACAFQGKDSWSQAPFDVIAIDPVGAGDAFDAGFIVAIRTGRSIGDALRLGAYCGAKVAEQFGENSGFPRRVDVPPSVFALNN
jgi:2-dehydro-3-deoxygluconokinase